MKYNAEGASTTPEFYRRQNADFLLFLRYSTSVNYKRFLFFDYFGFPYGGESIVMEGGYCTRAMTNGNPEKEEST